MGLFDSDFNIEKYVRDRIPELDNLANRDLFKRIVGSLTVDLYRHVKDEYDALERRVFDEAPKAIQLPDLITCVVSVDKYDLTDDQMFPIFAEDLEKPIVNSRDMIDALKNGESFFLYTCMFAVDYLTLKGLFQSSRRFKGIIEHEFGRTSAEFIVKPNDRYIKKAQELYEIAGLNYLPWRSLNLAYLFKLVDVYVVAVEEWDDQTEVREVTTDFEEFAEKILYKPLPLWNIREVTIKGNSYPQPVIDRKYFEHYLYKKQFRDGREYLLCRADTVVRNIRRQDGDFYIMCDEDLPADWQFYEFTSAPEAVNYENPLVGNERNENFSRNMIEYFGQRIKTRTEMIRFLNSFKASEIVEFVDAKIFDEYKDAETYSMEDFIAHEYRTGDRERTLEISFRAKDENFYLNRDIMSFLVTEIQHLFPEYRCVGKLVRQ
ncbi:MAG: hypothetical protein IJ685_04185 [Selenomonadaceae bacterium]|nr:hypothetical protein [Selenomonadaceae bacterium]